MSTASATRTRSPRAPLAGAILLVGAIAGLVLLVAGGGAPQELPEGLGDPGAVTGWGLPLTSAVSNVLAVAVAGCLLAAVLTMRRLDESLDVRGFRNVRRAGVLALAWAACTLLNALFVFSDQWGAPIPDLPSNTWGDFFLTISQGQSASAQIVLLLVLGVLSRLAATRREALGMLAVTLVAVVPPVLTGHAASSGSHDLAIISLAVHVVAAVLWIGGVLALWWRLDDDAELRGWAARRFSPLAAWCLAAVAISGVINALARVGGLSGVDTAYGLGSLAKLGVVLLVGAVAWRLRRAAVRALGREGRGRAAFAGLASVELGLMSIAVALGVALSRTPPPTAETYLTGAEALLGGPMPPAPTLERLALGYNASGVGLLVVGLGAAAYIAGLVALRRRSEPWPVLRTVSWFLGLAVFGYATLGGLGVYSHVMFSAHMASHMLLSMVAPILLVAGAPVNLALRALPGSDRPGGQGPRQVLAAVLRSRPARLLSHPATATALFVGSLYAVYFSGVFDGLMENHLGHAWMELHFLITGYLFYEALIGISPVPHRLPYLARLGLLLVVAPFHAFFSIALMSSTVPVGGSFYERLERPYATDLLADQNLGGSLSWALGEVPILMVVLILLFQWFRSDRAESRRLDRRADADDDAELRAYNEQLARISANDRRG